MHKGHILICLLAPGNINAPRKDHGAQDTADHSSHQRLPSTHEAVANSERAEDQPQTSEGSGDADMPDHATTNPVSLDKSEKSEHD